MLKDMQEVLEYTFEVFNKEFFDSALPPIVISIMSSARTNGHFTVSKVWRSEDNYMHEINISAEHLDRPIENICATMMHEMVHYYCELNGIADTSKNGRYHNKRFKTEAEKRGLNISYDGYVGYSRTQPTEILINIIDKYGITKPLDINRDGEMMYRMMGGAAGTTGTGAGADGIEGGDDSSKKKSSTRKYICPKCGNSFRATKDINVICGDCMTVFVKVDK